MRTKIGGHFKHKFLPRQSLGVENLLSSAKKLSANYRLTTVKDDDNGLTVVKKQNTKHKVSCLLSMN